MSEFKDSYQKSIEGGDASPQNFKITKRVIMVSLVAILIGGSALLGLGAFYLNLEILRPFSYTDCRVITISIDPGDGAKNIAEKLQKSHLIKRAFYFLTYVSVSGSSEELQAGEYEITPCMSIREIADKITRGEVIRDISFTIPEGFILKQIEERLHTLNLASEISDMKIGEFESRYRFLRDAPDGASLEGYLFPDTYFVKREAVGEEVVTKMLDTFGAKLDQELQNEIVGQGRTIYEIVTMASIIEKEVRTPEDKKLVSGILWKRISVEMPLQVDATITYILDKNTTALTYEDLETDSLYNTYRYRGLPSGPISNPGLESINAAIYPTESEYWYYLSKPDGETVFSKTLEEHNRAKQQYLR